ncbi:MAG: 23S rRNA (guanosine(2251)-2'-O)-methyltransferase RlmB [Gammaproteobacteria bacterium]
MSADDILVGIHAVRHALERNPERALEIWLLQDAGVEALAQIRALAAAAGVAVQSASRKTLDRLAQGVPHQGVALRRRRSDARPDDALDAIADAGGEPLLLALDGVYDPHNLGACLRSANAAGAAAVIAPLHRGAGLTPAAAKAASGAAEYTPLLQVRNLVRALARLKERGVRVIGISVGAGRDLWAADLRGPLCLVLGAEDEGLRHLTRQTCDELVGIPMRGTVESLNVSAATAICLFEALRQRRG